MGDARSITIRPFAFEFPDDLDPDWIPGDIYRAHFFNGVSLTMPYLEPYLIKTNMEARARIADPALLEDIRGFNGQESRHYECHRRLNEVLKKNGYPEFADIEARLERSYARLSKRSLRTRLAYSAGFETMTQGFTEWLIAKRTELLKDANPILASFWIMHMVEEAEHKTVAFDVYMACSGAYLPRALGVFHGSFHVLGFGVIGMLTALKKDGLLWSPRGLYGVARQLGSVAWNVGPALLRALLPWHNPRQVKDPDWMHEWVRGYATHPEGKLLPLIDTKSPTMPVPF